MKTKFPFVFLQSRYTTTDLFPLVEKLKPLALFLLPKSDKSLLQENFSIVRQLTKTENIVVQTPLEFKKKYRKQLKKEKKITNFYAPVTSSTLISLLFFLLESKKENKFKENQKIVVVPSDAFFVPSSELVHVLRNALYQGEQDNIIFLQVKHNNNEEIVLQDKGSNDSISSGCVILQSEKFLQNCQKFFPNIFNAVVAVVEKKKKKDKEYFFSKKKLKKSFEKKIPSLTIEEALSYFNKHDSSFALYYHPIDLQITVPKNFSSLLSLIREDENENKKYGDQQSYFYSSRNNSLLINQNNKKLKNKKIMFSSCENLLVVETDNFLLLHNTKEHSSQEKNTLFDKNLKEKLNAQKNRTKRK